MIVGLQSSILSLARTLQSSEAQNMITINGLVDSPIIAGLRDADPAAADAISSKLTSGELELQSTAHISWLGVFKNRVQGVLTLLGGFFHGT